MNYDKLSFEIIVEVKKEYKNISRHKRVLMPTVYSRTNVYINGQDIYKDQVFEEDVFFETLIKPGKYPLFNCTCGIFGCGGLYVEVIYHGDDFEWIAETPFISEGVPVPNKFVFSITNMISFADDLIAKLKELDELRAQYDIAGRNDMDKLEENLKKFKFSVLKRNV